jgi:hypothetical protein
MIAARLPTAASPSFIDIFPDGRGQGFAPPSKHATL